MIQTRKISLCLLLIIPTIAIGFTSITQIQSSYSTIFSGNNIIDLSKITDIKKSIDPLLGLSIGTIIGISAKITLVDDRNNVLDNGIKVDDVIKGYCIYDSSTKE